MNSHNFLKLMFDQQESIFESMAYSKEDVQLLCKAYGVTFKRNDSKVKLSEKLTAKIRATSQIPFPGSLMGPSQQPSTSNAEQEQGTSTSHVMS